MLSRIRTRPAPRTPTATSATRSSSGGRPTRRRSTSFSTASAACTRSRSSAPPVSAKTTSRHSGCSATTIPRRRGVCSTAAARATDSAASRSCRSARGSRGWRSDCRHRPRTGGRPKAETTPPTARRLEIIAVFHGRQRWPSCFARGRWDPGAKQPRATPLRASRYPGSRRLPVQDACRGILNREARFLYSSVTGRTFSS